jgi:hypothetical protein
VAATTPGDVIAFDLHTWHASTGGRDRLAWTAVYQRCPETDAERDRTLRSVHDSFDQVFRGFDTGPLPHLAGLAGRCRRTFTPAQSRLRGCCGASAPYPQASYRPPGWARYPAVRERAAEISQGPVPVLAGGPAAPRFPPRKCLVATRRGAVSGLAVGRR